MLSSSFTKKVCSTSLEWDWAFFSIRSPRISYFSLAPILYFPAAITAVNYFIHHVLAVFNSHQTVARYMPGLLPTQA